MRITRHGTNLTQLSWGGAIFPLNCYLVREPEGLTLVDTGLGFLAGGIIAAIRKEDAPLRRIVLTHGHMDHADGMARLLAAFPEAELGVGQREYLLMTGDRRVMPGEPGRNVRGQFYELKVKPRHLLAPGDCVGSLEVLPAAGHTPGQIALRDRRDATLLCGDAFHTVGGLTPITNLTLRFPWPYFANWDAPTAMESAARLLRLNVNRIAPGHGPVTVLSTRFSAE